MDTRCLEELGMSNAEIKVYLALLSLGSTTSGALSKETDLRKSTIYESIHRLLERGLVSYAIKNGVKHFQAAQPERLLDVLGEKKRKLEQNEQELKTFAENAHKKHDITKPAAEAHVLLGPEGFKTVQRDVLKHSKGELLLLGAISRVKEVMPYFYHQWDKERIRRKISFRILYKRRTKSALIQPAHYCERRFLPNEINNPVVINIYGDRVVSVIWKEDYPLCFMLINKDIANAYKAYFEVLWKLSAKEK